MFKFLFRKVFPKLNTLSDKEAMFLSKGTGKWIIYRRKR